MREFIVLAGQILFIALLQMVLEVFIDPEEKPHHVKILNIACILFCLYLLLEFAYNFLWGEITTFLPVPYF